MFPYHVGQPIGGEERAGYFLLQIHYDNPDMDTGVVDNSGLSILYTDKLREHDVFNVNLGVGVNILYHQIRSPSSVVVGFRRNVP